MDVPYRLAAKGLACAALCAVLCYLSGASWQVLAANATAAAVLTALCFDVAVLGLVAVSIVVMLTCAGVIAALLLGVWGDDLLSNLARMAIGPAKGALYVLPVAAVWMYAMVQLEMFSLWWGVLLCSLAMGCAAVAVLAGQIFTMVIVRILILPACLPGKIFSMLSGMPEDALDQCRETMTERSWEPLAVAPAEDGAQVDAMIWEGYANKSDRRTGSKNNGRWVIWFLGNGARYEECHRDLEMYAQDLNVSVCAFNYRGVGRSSGLAWSFDDLVADGKLVLQSLCDRKQLSPSDIMLHGHSLGGAVSTLVRVDHPGVVLINDRSFGALSEVPVAWARQLLNHAGNPLPAAVLNGICALIPYLMATMGWAAPINDNWVRIGTWACFSAVYIACATSIGDLTNDRDMIYAAIALTLWQWQPQRALPDVMSRTIILYHKKDEVLPYDGCSFHQAYLRSLGIDSDGAPAGNDQTDTAAAAAAQEKTAVRCVELELPPAIGRTTPHGDNDHGGDDRNGSPHNEWICDLPSWNEVARLIRAALQDSAHAPALE